MKQARIFLLIILLSMLWVVNLSAQSAKISVQRALRPSQTSTVKITKEYSLENMLDNESPKHSKDNPGRGLKIVLTAVQESLAPDTQGRARLQLTIQSVWLESFYKLQGQLYQQTPPQPKIDGAKLQLAFSADGKIDELQILAPQGQLVVKLNGEFEIVQPYDQAAAMQRQQDPNFTVQTGRWHPLYSDIILLITDLYGEAIQPVSVGAAVVVPLRVSLPEQSIGGVFPEMFSLQGNSRYILRAVEHTADGRIAQFHRTFKGKQICDFLEELKELIKEHPQANKEEQLDFGMNTELVGSGKLEVNLDTGLLQSFTAQMELRSYMKIPETGAHPILTSLSKSSISLITIKP